VSSFKFEVREPGVGPSGPSYFTLHTSNFTLRPSRFVPNKANFHDADPEIGGPRGAKQSQFQKEFQVSSVKFEAREPGGQAALRANIIVHHRYLLSLHGFPLPEYGMRIRSDSHGQTT